MTAEKLHLVYIAEMKKRIGSKSMQRKALYKH